MASATPLSQIDDGDRSLPDGTESIQDVIDMPYDPQKPALFVTVIGALLDYQPPIPTRGKGKSHWLVYVFQADWQLQI